MKVLNGNVPDSNAYLTPEGNIRRINKNSLGAIS